MKVWLQIIQDRGPSQLWYAQTLQFVNVSKGAFSLPAWVFFFFSFLLHCDMRDDLTRDDHPCLSVCQLRKGASYTCLKLVGTLRTSLVEAKTALGLVRCLLACYLTNFLNALRLLDGVNLTCADHVLHNMQSGSTNYFKRQAHLLSLKAA
eukprot:808573-Pelagomonas_calceolata.AAC.1